MSKEKNTMTRREFFKDAAIASAAVTATALLGTTAAEAAPVPIPKKWHKEADVVIIGYGARARPLRLPPQMPVQKSLSSRKRPKVKKEATPACPGTCGSIRLRLTKPLLI